MSITAYKVEANGHDRTGRDFGYVNICTAMEESGPVPGRIRAKRWRSCGRMRAFTDLLPPAARWETLS